MIVLFGLILLLFCIYPPMESRPAYETMIGLHFLALIFSIEIWKKIHWSVGIALLILLTSGLTTFFYPGNYQVQQDPFLITRGAGEILFSVVSLLLFSSLLLFKSREFFQSILRCLFFGALLDSLVLLFNFFFLHQSPPYAMLNNGTADASFIVCMLPMAFEKDRYFLREDRNFSMVIMLGALLITKSNTAYAGIGIAMAFTLLTKWNLKKWVLAMLPITLLVILGARIGLGNHFLVESGRLQIWKGSWEFYREFANQWLGFGTGTFTVWGINNQRLMHVGDSHFSIWGWLHLEPLEILFENGIVGLVSALTVYFIVLKRTFKKSVVFPIACVYGLTGFTEMPLRLWVTQILGVCFLSEAFKEK